jgi:formylglycine-generating enzyme required for sulfatase activity
MRRLLLAVLALIFICLSCENKKVEQIKVNVPKGITVPEKMVYIPSGDFIMGHRKKPETNKGERVTLEAFFIDRFEVTRKQYNVFNPAHMFNQKKAHFPVSMVTFQQGQDYCRWKNKRLPTEAEWEKSARGTDGRKWPWKIYYEHPNNGFSGFLPEVVDKRNEWISPYGVYGMGYNVWEWTSDWYDSGKSLKIDQKRYKVIRGGLTQTHTTIKFTPTYFRNKMDPKLYFNFIGFRCACSVDR